MAKLSHYRVTDAAKLVGLSRQRLWLYIRDGRCASVEVDGVCMITASEIERFKKSRNGTGRPKGNKRKAVA